VVPGSASHFIALAARRWMRRSKPVMPQRKKHQGKIAAARAQLTAS
jgi:hypothetical protein